MDEPHHSFVCEENVSYQGKFEYSDQKKQFKRRNSSIRSPSGAENDITDIENDTGWLLFFIRIKIMLLICIFLYMGIRGVAI